ncbi:energy-coupling factor ABC transporter permease [Azospira inquinata]|uniref:Energy-coupling factor ABC transporter permease n=1 Tax=Azospira inquinata TaxID=2785627 RepID=A0A975SMP4_9RHOO|nr:energy-coupling factor ABC transporter permease [Azospira inquinata]QWT45767.1 energy-coupling factor ABC transporter permease [Azospira inquinata]QWT48911.1 energy-coupling factor ABC transporter permease [Azospira inquinata]
MNLPDSLLAPLWYEGGWGLFVFVLGLAIWRAPWRRLGDNIQSNVWLGTAVSLTVLWSMKAGVSPGLNLHLLGAMVFTLEFGPALAFIGLTLVLAGITMNGAAGWASFGLNALLMGAVPVGISYAIYRFTDRKLPKNLFVYIFANGFFGSALMILGTGLAASGVLALAGAYTLEKLSEDFLPYFILLGFSEAWLAGMVLTLLVVYRPEWVWTFDDSVYLAKK